MGMKNPKCPKCGNKLKLSKLEYDMWHCKNCNFIISEKEIEHLNSVKKFKQKQKIFDV